MSKEFFPLRPDSHPMIYAYEDSNPEYRGLLKVGYTTIGVEQRVAQQYPTKRPDGKIPYRIVFSETTMYSDGGNFLDHDIHLDIAMAGTSATLLAKRWESALLVNVDNVTLSRLMANEDAMAALMNIEGFRSLNTEINEIIIASEKVKKVKAKGEKLTPKEKKELSAAEKERKSKRKDIQDKLIKFATRIPIFMYLTDFREYSLKDVITQLEQGLFKRVTGLNVKDFELLVSLGVFNDGLMNDAVYKFKRYEDSSLSYTGIDKHARKAVGGYDTVLTREEYDRLFGSQQISISEVTQAFDDLPDIDYDIIEKDDEDDVDTPHGKAPVSQKPASQTKLIPVQPNKNTSSVAKPQTSLASSKRNDDYSFVKPGLIVTHKTFGKGRVVKLLEDKHDTKIIVAFGKAEKMFMFPGAFKSGFLNLQ